MARGGVLILILCVTDALITLTLLGHGAHEANPLMDTSSTAMAAVSWPSSSA